MKYASRYKINDTVMREYTSSISFLFVPISFLFPKCLDDATFFVQLLRMQKVFMFF